MTRKIFVGGVAMGGGAPVLIPIPLNTKNHRCGGRLRQLHALKAAGCQIARLAVPPCRRGSKLRGDRGAIAPAFGGGHPF